MLSLSPHLPNVKVHSRVSLSSRKVWASKIMYRGSAAVFWWFCVNPGIPPQVPQKGDYRHLDNFLRLSST